MKKPALSARTFLIVSSLVIVVVAVIAVVTVARAPTEEKQAIDQAVDQTMDPAVDPATGSPADPVEKVYKIGIAPADVETPVESYLETINGINAQCDRVNQLLESVCCSRFDIGCQVRYSCEVIDVDQGDLLGEKLSQSYAWEIGFVSYPMHHGLVVRAIHDFLKSFRLYSEAYGGLVVNYTRHRIVVDDESTKDVRLKINTADLKFYFLGRILPGKTGRDGTMMVLDYYATQGGIMLNVSPTLDSSLALALAEFRSGIFSFNEKIFTGTGGRDLFELGEGGALVPNINGCVALAEREPPHFSSLLKP